MTSFHHTNTYIYKMELTIVLSSEHYCEVSVRQCLTSRRSRQSHINLVPMDSAQIMLLQRKQNSCYVGLNGLWEKQEICIGLIFFSQHTFHMLLCRNSLFSLPSFLPGHVAGYVFLKAALRVCLAVIFSP